MTNVELKLNPLTGAYMISVIGCPTQTVNGKTIVASIGNKMGITEDIYNQIIKAISDAENSSEWIEKQTRIRRNRDEAATMYAKRIKNGWCPKCESYCHGDCNS